MAGRERSTGEVVDCGAARHCFGQQVRLWETASGSAGAGRLLSSPASGYLEPRELLNAKSCDRHGEASTGQESAGMGGMPPTFHTRFRGIQRSASVPRIRRRTPLGQLEDSRQWFLPPTSVARFPPVALYRNTRKSSGAGSSGVFAGRGMKGSRKNSRHMKRAVRGWGVSALNTNPRNKGCRGMLAGRQTRGSVEQRLQARVPGSLAEIFAQLV